MLIQPQGTGVPPDTDTAEQPAHRYGVFTYETADNGQGRHRSWFGWFAAGTHVVSYMCATILAVAVAVAGLVLDLHVTYLGFIAGQLFSALTHLIIDRRFTLRWLMVQVDRVIPGKLAYYDNGGAPFLDQMAHFFCLFLASLLAAAVTF